QFYLRLRARIYSIKIFPDPVWISTGTPPEPTLPRTSLRPIVPCTVTGCDRLMDPDPVCAFRSNEAFCGRRSCTLPDPVCTVQLPVASPSALMSPLPACACSDP